LFRRKQRRTYLETIQISAGRRANLGSRTLRTVICELKLDVHDVLELVAKGESRIEVEPVVKDESRIEEQSLDDQGSYLVNRKYHDPGENQNVCQSPTDDADLDWAQIAENAASDKASPAPDEELNAFIGSKEELEEFRRKEMEAWCTGCNTPYSKVPVVTDEFADVCGVRNEAVAFFSSMFVDTDLTPNRKEQKKSKRKRAYRKEDLKNSKVTE